ncbi:MAG: S41 family peptidase [Bacteroidia bacterium]|nr:S41 family peptidase [Bacteroidia bacterium]MCX7651619.1 S41 family peptidase [Bacteroidia bacterium]MDW8417296.1 S41 family peptidase [Bacteroidia bacterium]
MKRRSWIGIIGSISLLLLIYWQDPLYRLGRNIEIYGRVLQELTQNYVDVPDLDRLTTKAIEAMLNELDPYTNFYSAMDVTQAQLEQSGQYAGVGIVLQSLEGKVLCRRVLPNSPAEKAGIEPGDLLIEIEKQPVANLSLDQIQKLLRGMPKTVVNIKIYHPTSRQMQEYTLTRAEIESEAVPFSTILSGQIGYIALTQFTRGCAEALRQHLIKLKTQTPLKGLILDLRGNPGGLMNEALDILNFFLPKGELLLETRGRMLEANQKYYAQMHPLEPTLPLVILIDEHSASASEIVAGTLQDLDRAVIIGKRSFGKGLVQVVRPLVENTQMKITVSRYYTPSGRSIQLSPRAGQSSRIFRTRNGRPIREGSGVTPDIEAQSYLPTAEREQIEPYFFYFLSQHRNSIPRDSATLTVELPPPAQVLALLDSLRHYPNMYKGEAEALLSELRSKLNEVSSIQPKLQEVETALREYRLAQLRRSEEALRVLVGQLRAYHGLGLRGEYSFITARDPVVKQAHELLSDLNRYEKILRP